MGTRRKVATWREIRKGEYLVRPAGWKPNHGDIVFTDRGDMLRFARASRMMLKQIGLEGVNGKSV